MRKHVLISGAALTCLLAVLLATDARGQLTPEEEIEALQNAQRGSIFQPVTAQFNFSPPGARSLGMGGAFVALADDATAAFANPAGLLQLSQQEVSFEGRNTGFGSEFISGGHAFGDPSCIGFDQPVGSDVTCPEPGGSPVGSGNSVGEDVAISQTDGDVTAISFLSYVYPVNRRFAVAAYRQELANFEAAFQSPGFFVNVPLATGLPGYKKELGNGSAPLRVFPSRTSVDLKIDSIGVSAAFRPTDDLSIGLGVSTYGFDYELQSRNFGVVHFTQDVGAPTLDQHPFFQPIQNGTFDPNNLRTIGIQQGSDDELGVLAGILWNFAERWTLGGVYRQGPEFGFNSVVTDGAGNVLPDEEGRPQRLQGVFHVPDVFAVGLVFRPLRTSKISFEYTLVEYSNLTEQPGVPPFGLTEDVTTDDADEVHIGFEHVFVKTKYPIAVRAGAWNDPDHRIRFDAPSSRGQQGPTLQEINAIPDPDLRQQAYQDAIQRIARARIDETLFRPGPNDFHYSVGVGIVFNRIQLDAAVDLSELVDTFSFSGVFRF